MFRSIRFRLALWYTIVFALTFVIIAWSIYTYFQRTLTSSLDQSLTNEIGWIMTKTEQLEERHEPLSEVQEEIFEHGAFSPIKKYIEIWDTTGNIFYHSPNLGNDDTLSAFGSLPDHENSSITTVPAFRNHEVRLGIQRTALALIYVAIPTESVTAPVTQLLRVFTWLGPVVIVVAAAGGAFVAKKSLSKMNQVIEIAQRITADRLYDRIPEHNTKDEIGKIVSTFNEMISRLDVSFGQMKQFSADASHELRTPLSVMRAQLETALDSKTTYTEFKKITANCLDETLRMTSIIDSLLLLAKSDSGQQLLKQEPVDLQRLVQQAHEESIILASLKSIKVTLQDVGEVTVLGDEQRLRQMLLNLIDNAIKYSHPNGTIQMVLAKDDGLATISVIDDGIGIPSSEIPRIFDRFYRVDRARSRELGGTGLGLSIAKWIVHAHGGTIAVESELEKGSKFIVALPMESPA